MKTREAPSSAMVASEVSCVVSRNQASDSTISGVLTDGFDGRKTDNFGV
jgi:hypothetical protein